MRAGAATSTKAGVVTPTTAADRWARAEQTVKSLPSSNAVKTILSPTMIGDDAPVSLRFLIEDYVSHQRWHVKQMTIGTSLSEEQSEA